MGGPLVLLAAANAGCAEQTLAFRKARVCTGGAQDRPHGAYDDVRLPVAAPLDEVIAAHRDDVDVVDGKRRKFVLHRAP